jgi:prophage antirepressor-like protein
MKIANTNPLAFDFQGRNVRTVHVHGQPWFVVKDVCSILGIKQATRAIESLRNEERGVSSIHTLGGEQQMLTVNESGLYALIFQSRKPAAQDFRFWVTNEVLPALRKTGFYDLGREMLEDKANWEMARARGRMALLRELQDLERDPKVGLEYLTVTEFLDRQGIRFDSRVEGMRFARQVQLACQQVGEWPVKQYRRRNRIPATLWPEPVLRTCLGLLPPPAQPTLPLH